MLEAMCKRWTNVTKLDRAEDGRRGDGRRPPQARNGRGMHSRAEFLQPRPPDGAKRRRGALAELNRRFKGCECDGVGTRRVETPRGQGAKRPVVIQKLHIDDGCLGGGDIDGDGFTGDDGGGGNIPLDTEMTDNEWVFDANSYTDQYFTDSSSERVGIFRHCMIVHTGQESREGGRLQGTSFFYIDDERLDDPHWRDMAQTFMHELGHAIGLPEINQKGPEYLSVMNYDWVDNDLSWPIDYYTGWFHDPDNGNAWTYVDEWGSLDLVVDL